MIKLRRYNPERVWMFPSGRIADYAAFKESYPAIDVFPHVIETVGDTCQAISSLSAIRHRFNIDESMSDDDAIAAIEVILNTPPPEVERLPSPEERIAAALEFQNLMGLE